MDFVTSKDGTQIAYDRVGAGSPVVLVCGGSVDRSINGGVAQLLGDRFTVFNYDRRGRGPSGDTPPYGIQREVEDMEAIIEVAGGAASVYGSSSRAALVFEAAAAGGAGRQPPLLGAAPPPPKGEPPPARTGEN